jgi:hypothetical protein
MHRELWEGLYLINLFYCLFYLNISGISINSYSNKLHKFPQYKVGMSKRGIHTDSKGLNKSLI